MFGAFKNLFKEAGVKDVVTIFHSPKSPASIRAHTFLKQSAANAQATATEDQASSHEQQSKDQRTEFELDVQEGEPTSDQLTNIIEYLGADKVGTVVEGATSPTDALRKLKENGDLFKRPVIVDWGNGRAVAGDNESEILKLVKTVRK
ncbi:thioredoxin-like protein [Delphinella strobiligena]|nr:thioredoxin-like protein [Delphinella strobiligena]